MAAKKGRTVTIPLVVFCLSFQALVMGGIALLLPSIRQDLGLTFTQGGSLAAAGTLVYALMQIPAGYLCDRFSPKRLFFIGSIGLNILALTFGLATAYWQALVNQTLLGVFRAFLFATGLALLTRWSLPHRRATAMALYLTGGLSGTVAFNLLGPLIVARFDWRFAFISVSSLGIIASLTFWRFGRQSPLQGETRRVDFRDALRLFRSRLMWVCGGIQYVRLAVVMGITFWLPSLLIDEKGLPLALAGMIMAAQAMLIVPSNILGGYISDRLKNPNLVIGVSLIVLGVTAWLLVTVSNMALLIGVIGLNAMFLQMYFGPLFSIPVEVLGTHRAGMSSGFGNLFANVGAFSFTYLLGVLKDATGAFAPGFHTIAAICAVGVTLNFVLWRMRRKALATSA